MTDPVQKTIEKSSIEILSLEIFSEISRIAHSTLDLKKRLDTIVDKIAEKMGTDGCYISLLDKDEKHLTLKATRGLNIKAVDKVMLNIGEGITGWVAQEKKAVALPDAHLDPRFKYVPETGEDKFRSMLAVPITVQDKCIGVLTVQTYIIKEYSQEEITILNTIAREIGGIIKNAQLYKNINDRLLDLTTLHEVGQAMTSTLDLETLLKLIIKNSVNAIKARGGVLRLLDTAESGKLVVKAYSMPEEDAGTGRLMPLSLGEGLAGKIAESGKPILIPDIHSIPASQRSDDLGTYCAMGIPLKIKDNVIGTITLYDKISTEGEDLSAFSNEDLKLLTTLASQASIAIENATLYQQTLKNAREMETLFSLSKGLTSILDLRFVLDSILRMVCELLGGNFGILTLYDEKSQELVTKSVYGLSSTSALPILRFKLGEGTTGWIGEQKDSINLDHIDSSDKKNTLSQ